MLVWGGHGLFSHEVFISGYCEKVGGNLFGVKPKLPHTLYPPFACCAAQPFLNIILSSLPARTAHHLGEAALGVSGGAAGQEQVCARKAVLPHRARIDLPPFPLPPSSPGSCTQSSATSSRQRPWPSCGAARTAWHHTCRASWKK